MLISLLACKENGYDQESGIKKKPRLPTLSSFSIDGVVFSSSGFFASCLGMLFKRDALSCLPFMMTMLSFGVVLVLQRYLTFQRPFNSTSKWPEEIWMAGYLIIENGHFYMPYSSNEHSSLTTSYTVYTRPLPWLLFLSNLHIVPWLCDAEREGISFRSPLIDPLLDGMHTSLPSLTEGFQSGSLSRFFPEDNTFFQTFQMYQPLYIFETSWLVPLLL